MLSTVVVLVLALGMLALGGCGDGPASDSGIRLLRVIEVQGRQGVATDGERYFVSGSMALYAYDKEGILLLSNVITSLSTFFLSQDLELLMASPADRLRVYGARLAETILNSSWMVVLLVVPLFLAYGFTYRADGAFYLLAAGVMVAVVLSTRRGRPRKMWMPLAIGLLFHLLLDAMWLEPETLWWPLLGWDFSAAGPATMGGYLESVLTDWRVWAGEVLGLLYLVYLWVAAGLSDPAKRRNLLRTGRVDSPIDGDVSC